MKPTSTLGQSPRRVVASLRRRHEEQEKELEFEEDFEELDATTSTEKKRNSMKLPSVRNVTHTGFHPTDGSNASKAQKPVCFGCWSAGRGKSCTLHEEIGPQRMLRADQSNLVCSNWDLGSLRHHENKTNVESTRCTLHLNTMLARKCGHDECDF